MGFSFCCDKMTRNRGSGEEQQRGEADGNAPMADGRDRVVIDVGLDGIEAAGSMLLATARDRSTVCLAVEGGKRDAALSPIELALGMDAKR